MNNSEFSMMQPQFDKRYVMIDWDDTASLNPQMFLQIFSILKENNFTPKIFTARKEIENNEDIFLWFKKEDVLFSNGQQKKDAMFDYRIFNNDVSFWIDDQPQNIVDKEDLDRIKHMFTEPENVLDLKYKVDKDSRPFIMIDWDETMSLNPEMFLKIIDLFSRLRYNVKIFTARRSTQDNSDIFAYVDKKDVLFAEREPKIDALQFYGIKEKNVAFWIDDMPSAIINKKYLIQLLGYLNS